MSAAGPPKCKNCGKEHWQRDGCDGRLQERVGPRKVIVTVGKLSAQDRAERRSPPISITILPKGVKNIVKAVKKKGRKKK